MWSINLFYSTVYLFGRDIISPLQYKKITAFTNKFWYFFKSGCNASFLYTILPFLTYKICNIRKGKSVYILSFYCLYLHCFSLVFIGIIISILYTFQIWKVLFSWEILYKNLCFEHKSEMKWLLHYTSNKSLAWYTKSKT